MPERYTRTQAFRAGAPLTVGSVTLLPIERIETHADRGNGRAWFLVSKAPYALVVRDAVGLRAFGTDATSLPMERLREKIPELDAALASM